jgi:hypothetical protein
VLDTTHTHRSRQASSLHFFGQTPPSRSAPSTSIALIRSDLHRIQGHINTRLPFQSTSPAYSVNQTEPRTTAKTSAASKKAAKKVKPATHAEVCKHHSDPRKGLCTVSKLDGTRCTYRAKATKADCLPTCGIHQNEEVKAGKCQAVAHCGQVCNRVTPDDAGYHFCSEHEKGTDTLPCRFLDLPAELRLMVYGYIFPPFIPSTNLCDNDKIKKPQVAVLRVNKQIYQEASSVLYDELPFHARVTPTTITVLGKTWHRSHHKSALLRNEPLDINKTLAMEATKRIRNLVVEVSFGKWRTELQGCTRSHLFGGVVLHGITNENYDLYEAKDSVRKLADLFPASRETGSLKRLTVQPKMGPQYRWTPAESIAAVFLVLEPFQDLHVVQQAALEAPEPSIVDGETRVDYEKLQEVWITAVKTSTPPRTSAKAIESRAAFHKIEELIRLVKEVESQNSRYNRNNGLSKFPIFHGIERPLHLARVACENEDPWMIDQIRKAIAARWDNHQQQKQRAAKVISDAIKNMLGSTDTTTSGEEHQDVSQPAAVEAVPEGSVPTFEWSELQSHKINATPLPKRGDPGVTIEEDSLRMYYHLDDKTWIRLKTPGTVRLKVAKQL